MRSTGKQSQTLILYLPALPLCPPPSSLFDIIIHGKLLIVMENWSTRQHRQRHSITGGCAGQLGGPSMVNVSGIGKAKSH